MSDLWILIQWIPEPALLWVLITSLHNWDPADVGRPGLHVSVTSSSRRLRNTHTRRSIQGSWCSSLVRGKFVSKDWNFKVRNAKKKKSLNAGGRRRGEREFQERKWKKRIRFCGRDYLWMLSQLKWFNHLNLFKLQNVGEKKNHVGIIYAPKLTYEKSTDGEKTEEDKCCLLFCWRTSCLSSLFYSDAGTATFKISVNAGVCLN